MKKIWIGTVGTLLAVVLLFGGNLITTALNRKENENAAKLREAQDQALLYSQRVAELEQKLDELKSEQYANKQAYENQISELELKLSAKDAISEDTQVQSDAKYTYTVSEKGITITGYQGSDKKLILPKQIDGVNVIGIGREAFKGAEFEEVVLSGGIEKIDWFAFSQCANLKNITIPNSVNKIEYGVFDGVKSFKINCSENSYAHKYAKSYGYVVELK